MLAIPTAVTQSPPVVCEGFLRDVLILMALLFYIHNAKFRSVIRASVDALRRDDTSEISRDPCRKRLQTRRESLAMHTNKNF